MPPDPDGSIQTRTLSLNTQKQKRGVGQNGQGQETEKGGGNITHLEIQLSDCSEKFFLREKQACIGGLARRGQSRLWAGRSCRLEPGVSSSSFFPLISRRQKLTTAASGS